MTTVLGLHGFSAASKRVMHDTGVTLVRDGHVVAAINEERLTRKKNDGSFPRRALDTVLQMTRVGPEDIDLVAMPDERPLWQMAMVLNFSASFRTLPESWSANASFKATMRSAPSSRKIRRKRAKASGSISTGFRMGMFFADAGRCRLLSRSATTLRPGCS